MAERNAESIDIEAPGKPCLGHGGSGGKGKTYPPALFQDWELSLHMQRRLRLARKRVEKERPPDHLLDRLGKRAVEMRLFQDPSYPGIFCPGHSITDLLDP